MEIVDNPKSFDEVHTNIKDLMNDLEKMKTNSFKDTILKGIAYNIIDYFINVDENNQFEYKGNYITQSKI